MLVLSRKQNEEVMIGDETFMVGDQIIRIIVFKISGGQVKLGIEADRRVPIRRGELPPTGQLLDEVA